MIVHYFFSRVIVALLSRDFIRFISTTNSCRLWICHVTHFHCFAHTRMVFVQIHSRVPFANVNSILIIWFFFSSHILFCANFRFLFSVCSFLFWILTSIKMYIYLHGLRSICLRLSFIYFILLHACCFSHIARERERKKERQRVDVGTVTCADVNGGWSPQSQAPTASRCIRGESHTSFNSI